jgi:hypothetical protein
VQVGHVALLQQATLNTVLMGRAEIGLLALICFPEISELVQIIAKFKNLHMTHLTPENYETNFVG